MGKVNQRWRRNKLVCIVCILILCHCICGAAFAKTPDEKRLADAIVDIQANPESAVAYNNLGVAYRRLGRFDEAVAAYKKALALDPSLGAIHRNLGVALMKTGVWSEAREAFSRALQIEPTHATTHVNLGVVCINMGLFDDAVNVLKQALAIDAELKDARTHLDHAMKMAEKVSTCRTCGGEECVF
ncbi:MAG TPA: tetratricopeptide repeat protein [Synergistaceae bacterium]|nr:tetratricopeptide repeat protein [Synergistaceae bacterium]